MLHEIDERADSANVVTMYWDDEDDTIVVPRADARLAFGHPYAYAVAA